MISPHVFASSLPTLSGLTAKTADGRALPVLATPKGGLIAFDLSAPAGLVLERAGGWKGVAVKPARAGALVRIEGPRLHLDLTSPRPVLVELPGGQLLSILAKPPGGDPPTPVGQGRLRRFAGGQVHEVGALRLQDGDVLWLDAGAWLRGQVHASGATGISIGGRGIIENPPPAPGQPSYRTVLLDHCRNVEISGVHLLTCHGWMITVGGCEDVTIDTLSEEGNGPGTDGIDIVGSRRVHIRHCFLINGDDNIAIKAMDARTQVGPPACASPAFNGDWTGPVEDILVEQCAFWNDHGGSAMEIGYETRTERIGGITFRAIDVMAVHRFGSVFGIHAGDRALVEGILWEDIHVEHHYDKLVDFRILRSRWNLDERRGRVRDVTLRAVRAAQSPYNAGYTTSLIGGWDADHRITGVTFEDFHLGDRPVRDGDALDLHTKQTDRLTFR